MGLSEAIDDPWKDLCSTLGKYLQKHLLYRVLVIPGSVPNIQVSTQNIMV